MLTQVDAAADILALPSPASSPPVDLAAIQCKIQLNMNALAQLFPGILDQKNTDPHPEAKKSPWLDKDISLTFKQLTQTFAAVAMTNHLILQSLGHLSMSNNGHQVQSARSLRHSPSTHLCIVLMLTLSENLATLNWQRKWPCLWISLP